MKFRDITLKEHQVEFLRLIQKHPNYYFAWGGGSGKTMMLSIIAGSLATKQDKASLTVTTPLLCVEYRQNLARFWDIPDHEISDLSRPKDKKAYINGERSKLVCMTYQGLLNDDLMNVLKTEEFDILFLDEAHKIKNPKGKIANSLFDFTLSNGVKRRYLFSATMLTKDYEDLFMQFKILDGGETLGLNFWSGFKSKYFKDDHASWRNSDGYHPKYSLRDGAKEELLDKISVKSHFIRTSDVTDLPPYKLVEVEVDMSTDQKRDYDALVDKSMLSIAEAGNKFIRSFDKKGKPVFISKQARQLYLNHALSVLSKLRQIASGFFLVNEINEDGAIDNTHYNIYKDNGKIKFVERFLQKNKDKEKIIIWHHYRFTGIQLQDLCDRIRVKYSILKGGLTSTQKEHELDKFKHDDSVRVMIANPKSAGEGVNLTLARVCIYFTQDYSYKDDFQSAMRNYRYGSTQHKSVIRINLLTKGTVDVKLKENIQKKSELAEFVVQYVQSKKEDE